MGIGWKSAPWHGKHSGHWTNFARPLENPGKLWYPPWVLGKVTSSASEFVSAIKETWKSLIRLSSDLILKRLLDLGKRVSTLKKCVLTLGKCKSCTLRKYREIPCILGPDPTFQKSDLFERDLALLETGEGSSKLPKFLKVLSVVCLKYYSIRPHRRVKISLLPALVFW